VGVRLAFESEKCQDKSRDRKEELVENFIGEFGYFDEFKILMMESDWEIKFVESAS
jgi:hypothetical protein